MYEEWDEKWFFSKKISFYYSFAGLWLWLITYITIMYSMIFAFDNNKYAILYFMNQYSVFRWQVTTDNCDNHEKFINKWINIQRRSENGNKSWTIWLLSQNVGSLRQHQPPTKQKKKTEINGLQAMTVPLEPVTVITLCWFYLLFFCTSLCRCFPLCDYLLLLIIFATN